MRGPIRPTLIARAAGALALGLALAGTAQAMTFAEAFAAARQSDPAYRSAAYQLQAVREGVPIARAALLPQVNATVNRTDVSGTRQFYNAANQEVKLQLDYAAPTSSLQARLALYNREGHKRLDQVKAQVDSAEAEFRARGLELMDRVGTAYLQVLLGEEQLGLSEAQIVAAQGQVDRATQRLKRGEGTRIEESIAQVALDVAKVRKIETRDQLELARRGLKRLTGLDTPPLNRPIADFRPDEAGMNIAEWMDLARRNNPMLEARQHALMAARLGVQRQNAQHHPRVDLVASISRDENDSVSNLGQVSTLKRMGVQVNIPLYSGGGIEASVRQAVAEQQRAEEDIRNERENVEIEIQRHHLAVSTGAERVDAYRRAAESSDVALTGTRRAQESGLGTTADVLDAQARLFQSRRDLAQARFEYLSSRLRLQAQAGYLVDDISLDIDRLLPVKP